MDLIKRIQLIESLAYIREEKIRYSGSKILSLARKQFQLVYKKDQTNCERWSLKLFKQGGEKIKEKRMKCLAIAEKNGYIAEIKFIKSMASKCKDENCVEMLKERVFQLNKWIKELNDEISGKEY